MSGILYLEHLSDADLRFLAAVTGEGVVTGEWLSRLRTDAGYLDGVLANPAVYARLFGSDEDDVLLRASPFLVFAVLVQRVAHDLSNTRFVEEWIGPGRRVPMFDVSGLRHFAAQSQHRLFLAELLASYTRVVSGSVWVQTDRGWRRRRFSELDPIRIVELLEMVPDQERPALHRRLGDLALFLTGIFPDYAGGRLLASRARGRLQRAVPGSGDEQADSLFTAGQATGDLELLERLGSRSYRLAWKAAESGSGDLLVDLANGFGQARRVLNFLTDRYVFPFRQQWFPQPES